MIPDHLSSSYRQYKHDTTAGFDWLLQTARKQEWPVGRQELPLMVTDYVYIAEECVAAGIQMPELERRLLGYSLSTRRKCSQWFRSQADTNSEWKASDIKHAFFTDQLERILACFPTAASDMPARPTEGPEWSTELGDKLGDIAREQGLGSNDDDTDNDSNTSDGGNSQNGEDRSGSASDSGSTLPGDDMVDRTDDEDMEMIPIEDTGVVEIFCLLNDAKRLRDYLRGVWARYEARATDAITASVVTQAAFTAFGKIETDFIRRFPHLPFIGNQIAAIYLDAAVGKTHNYTCSVPQDMLPPEDGPIIADAEGPMGRFTNNLASRVEASGWEPTQEMEEWTFHPTSVMLETMAELTRAGVGVDDEAEQRRSLTPKYEYCLRDLRRLRRLHAAGRPGSGDCFPALDLLALAFCGQEIVPGGIRLALAFMCRVFLDIPEGLTVPLDERRAAEGHIADYKKHDKCYNMGFPAGWCEDLARDVSPGTYGLRLVWTLHKVAELRGQFCSLDWRLIDMAHLYNALRVTYPKTPAWPDMDAVIALQKNAIFAGEPPRTGGACEIRHCVARGWKLSDLAKSRQDKVPSGNVDGPRSALDVSVGGMKTRPRAGVDAEWLRNRNTSGRRRELVLAPFLEGLLRQRRATRCWEPALDCRLADGAFRRELRSMGVRLKAGDVATTGVDIVSYVEAMERVIRREVPVLFFHFSAVSESGPPLFGQRLRVGDWLDRLHNKTEVRGWQRKMAKKEGSLRTVTKEWQSLCTKLRLDSTILSA